MHSVEKSLLVPHSAATMFQLVDAVEDYPAFLPWCAATAILSRDDSMTVARIDIGYHGIKHAFTTANRKQGLTTMHIELVEGPFHSLVGRWHFTALSEAGCKIEFRLDYEFSSKVLEKLSGPVFDHIAQTLVERFVQRAEALAGASVPWQSPA